MRLHLGAGGRKLPGYKSVDIRPNVGADIVSDVRNIPVTPGSVEEIYASHVLEHFTMPDALEVLKYWHSLLGPGGKLYIALPDFLTVAWLYWEYGTTLNKLLPLLFGGQNYKENYHYTTWDWITASNALEGAGFRNIHRWEPSTLGITVYQTMYGSHGREPAVEIKKFPARYYDYSMLMIDGKLASLNIVGEKP